MNWSVFLNDVEQGKPLQENTRSCRCECPAMIRLLWASDQVEKDALYKGTHTRPDKWEKWRRVVFLVRMHDNGEHFECECGLSVHMPMYSRLLTILCISDQITKPMFVKTPIC
ncbi:hypothetical protein VPH35_044533 [Triticum aestivum]